MPSSCAIEMLIVLNTRANNNINVVALVAGIRRLLKNAMVAVGDMYTKSFSFFFATPSVGCSVLNSHHHSASILFLCLVGSSTYHAVASLPVRHIPTDPRQDVSFTPTNTNLLPSTVQ